LVDIFQALITVGLTLAVATPIFIIIGNLFLKKAFEIASSMIGDMLTKPAVSKAMGILGKKSGESRRNSAMENEIATSIINKTIGPYKLLITKVIGIDIDEMIEEYGAMEVLNTLQQFLPLLQQAGVKLPSIESLMGQGQQPQNSNRIGEI